MFGKESSGIPYDILKNDLEHCLRIPMSINARSLNLSNCVAIVAYEAVKQQDFNSLSTEETFKGASFLKD
jgi:tRNA (cytidine/uridine-2'-O-)-methyltransferase